MADREASSEEQGVDPEVEGQSSVDLVGVEDLVVPLAQMEGEDADWLQGGAGCPLVAPCPQCLSCLIHRCILPLLLLLHLPLVLTDLKENAKYYIYNMLYY